MNKKAIFVALIAVFFMLTGCNKNGAKGTLSDKFVGKYDLVIDYEVYIDGEYSKTDQMKGTLSITAVDDKTVCMEGIVNMNSGDATLYETTGTVDEKGVLHLASSTYDKGTGILEISYGSMTYKSPLQFSSTMSTELQGHEVVHEMENKATKL